MGQTIQINRTVQVGEVLVLDTDRSLAGQDGEAFSSPEQAAADDTFPARLAGTLFAADPQLDHVFVMSNTVTVRRPAGWDEQAIAAVTELVAEFFRFYRPEGPGPGAVPPAEPQEV